MEDFWSNQSSSDEEDFPDYYNNHVSDDEVYTNGVYDSPRNDNEVYQSGNDLSTDEEEWNQNSYPFADQMADYLDSYNNELMAVDHLAQAIDI